jgi:hypothetical protein
MTMTRRRAILEAVKARLEAIRRPEEGEPDTGFATDAGQTVTLNEAPAFGDDDPPVAIAIVVGEEQVTWQNGRLLILLPLDIQVLSVASLDAPWVAIEDVLGDVKRAMELGDRRLNRLLSWDMERGGVRTLEREPGHPTVGAAIPYQVRFMEAWGEPGKLEPVGG